MDTKVLKAIHYDSDRWPDDCAKDQTLWLTDAECESLYQSLQAYFGVI